MCTAASEKNNTVLYIVLGLVGLLVVVGVVFMLKAMSKPSTQTQQQPQVNYPNYPSSGSGYQTGKGWQIYQGVLGGLGVFSDILGDWKESLGWGNNSGSGSAAPGYNPDQNDYWA